MNKLLMHSTSVNLENIIGHKRIPYKTQKLAMLIFDDRSQNGNCLWWVRIDRMGPQNYFLRYYKCSITY